MTKKILHIIQGASLGGAMRAAFAVARYSSRSGEFQHSVLALSRAQSDPAAIALAREYNIEVTVSEDAATQDALIAAADAVIVNWWNNPEVDSLFRRQLPPTRLALWCHVGGSHSPQLITSKLISFADLTIACSPYTYECHAIQSLPTAERLAKTSMVYGATDFARIEGVSRVPHDRFTVGYIGTVDFVKLHRSYVSMSAGVKVPRANFVVCGSGAAIQTIQAEAAALGKSDQFEIRGQVDDIRPVLSILDVYGYPLCEETYAAAELNLQEVMYAGIPVVSFPHGGIRNLLVDNFTGYLVRSEREYQEAIEYLYHHPEERQRIGENAARYARQIFGAENGAKKLNQLLTTLLTQEKKLHLWDPLSTPGTPPVPGHRRFIESLGTHATDFLASVEGTDAAQAIEAELRIASCKRLMAYGGFIPYARSFPSDPYLNLWTGLYHLTEGQLDPAYNHLIGAINSGFNHWRGLWYLLQVIRVAGRQDLAVEIEQKLRHMEPRIAQWASSLPTWGVAQR